MNDEVIGWIGTLIALICFGSMFVPIKPYDTKDGFFVQWMQTCGILFLGVVVHIIQGFPQFYALAFCAGLIWATGNICTVPIINMIGSSLGFMIWGTVQIVTGWATARFGWFGLDPEKPKLPWMQYLGVAITIVSGFLFILVKPESPTKVAEEEDSVELQERRLIKDHQGVHKSAFEMYGTKIIAITMALFAGFMFGESLTPVTYLELKVDGASPHGLDHAFAFSVGTCTGGTLYFVIYAMFMKNRPFINIQAAMPAFFYGIIWAVAQFAWFVASEKMSQAVTFPIITRAPAIIATLWGVIVFREIKGKGNLLLMAFAILVALSGVVLVGLSDSELFA